MKSVLLRKVALVDLEAFEQVFQSVEGASKEQWFGFWDSSRLTQALEVRQLLGGDSNMLAIEAEGELVGRVEWIRKAWGRVDTSSCWEIAIGLFPSARGRGIGTEAQRLLTDYLFTHYPIERIQVTTAAENTAEKRCLTKLDYKLEGVIRRAQWRDGDWHDQLLYSKLRCEWKAQQQ